jgi:serine protease AprX
MVLRRSALALACFAAGGAMAAEVNPVLMQSAMHDGAADALLVLPDQSTPVLAPLAQNADYRVRRRALVDALRARADTQQQALRAWLDAHGVTYRAYWIANLVWARLTPDQMNALAGRADLARIEPDPKIPLRLPPQHTGSAPASVDSIAWGVTKINAPDVWAEGFTGQGVVIGGEDTGYQWDHPALEPQYRGWDGATADHDYNWHDAIHDAASGNTCGSDSPFPCDDVGHGTHTAGTFAGDDGATHQIGVAPGAKWIGCRNMDAGNGTPARYIECMQWMMAPTDLNDQNPNPDLAADVISNSWSCPPSEGCTVGDEIEEAVNNVVAAGIFYVAAAQNSGPNCSTIFDPPGTYDASFTIGATDTSDALAGFSSRGPVPGSDLIRPDISAPGVNVFSSLPTNTYGTLSGTSMATPHVAGAAALLMSVDPALKGHPDQLADILRQSATTDGVTDPVNQTCGGTTRDQWPNNMVGYGRLDVYAAAVLVQTAEDTIMADGFDGAGP